MYRNFSSRARVAGAALVAVFLLMSTAPAGAWSEFGVDEKKAETPTGPEIKEPFFRFLIHMAQQDSLGRWTGEEVRAHDAAEGSASNFPLDLVVSITRERPDPQAARKYTGTAVRAVWTLVLAGPQDNPMPYSILGYHPGSLRISKVLVLSELAPTEIRVSYEEEGEPVTVDLTDVRIFPLEQGYVLLDADGFLDKLLGSALDDAWTVGFVTAREEGRLIGLGVSLGRNGRKIYGEFDFSADKVVAHGRGPMSGLSSSSRRWLNPDHGLLPVPWVENGP